MSVIDLPPASMSPGESPAFETLVGVPVDLVEQVVNADARDTVHNHAVMSAAATAVDHLRPDADVLRAVQEDVSAWMAGSHGESLASMPARERMSRFLQHLGERGSAALFDLDATSAFLERQNTLGIAARHDIALDGIGSLAGKSLLEAAPALWYASPEDRRKLVEGLEGIDDEHLATLLVATKTEEPVAAAARAHTPPEAQAPSTRPEIGEKPKFGVRNARRRDLAAMVEIDMRSFDSVYKHYGMTEDELRADLRVKFENRFRLLGGKWMPVLTRKDENGKDRIVGFMTGCPTKKGPDDFKSWEKTTGDGTLDELYDRNGDHLYVVTLSVDPSIQGEHGQDQLYMRLMSRAIENRIEFAYFESRLPGLRTWVKYKYCKPNGLDFNAISKDEDKMMELALQYSELTKIKDGKEVPYDRLLKVYSADFGAKINRIVANAYKDEPSMNFGALYTLDNPLPPKRHGWLTSKLAGRALGIASRSTSVTQKVMKKLQEIF